MIKWHKRGNDSGAGENLANSPSNTTRSISVSGSLMSLQQPTSEGNEFILAQLRSSNTDRWASSLQAFRGAKGMHIGACSPLSFVAVKNIMTKNSSGREGFI